MNAVNTGTGHAARRGLTLLLVLLLGSAAIWQGAAPRPARAVELPGFDFDYAPLPAGWVMMDKSAERGAWAVEFVHPSDGTEEGVILNGDITLERIPTEYNPDLATCLTGITIDEQEMGTNFWGMPGVRYEHEFTGEPGRAETFSGYPARVVSVAGTVREYPPDNPSEPIERGILEMRWICLQPTAHDTVRIMVWTGEADKADTDRVLAGLVFGPAGVPLCEQAVAFFGADYLAQLGFNDLSAPTRMRTDHDQLLVDFQQAIFNYNEKHATQAYASVPISGSLRAGLWLAKEGGAIMPESMVKDFVFNTRPDPSLDIKDATARQRGLKPLLPKGSEPALYDDIVIESNARAARGENPRLGMGEVLQIALEHAGGDARLALLLAHNTMRSLAREGDQMLTGVAWDQTFFDKHIEVIRADNPDNPLYNDKGGPVYHVFGTAYFEMESRGDYLPFPWLMGMLNSYGEGMTKGSGFVPLELIRAFYAALTERLDPNNPMGASNFANAYEQFQRWKGASGPEDPEKFCFNYWGAKIGAELFAQLGGGITDSLWRGAGNIQPSLYESFRKMMRDIEGLYGVNLFVGQSPVSFTWRTGEHTMTLDQTTGTMTGFVPALVLPLWEESTATWGVVWLALQDEPWTLDLTAAQDGTLHLLRLDTSTNEAAAYIADVHYGDRLSMEIVPGAEDPPALIRADGTGVEPVVARVTPSAATPVPATPGVIPTTTPVPGGGAGGGGSATWVVLVGGAALVAVAGAVLSRRRRRAPAAPAPEPAWKPAVDRARRIEAEPEAAMGPVCALCGERAEPDARFCKACGARLPELAVEQAPVFCVRCGARLTPGAPFCGNCGAEVAEMVPVEAGASQPAEPRLPPG